MPLTPTTRHALELLVTNPFSRLNTARTSDALVRGSNLGRIYVTPEIPLRAARKLLDDGYVRGVGGRGVLTPAGLQAWAEDREARARPTLGIATDRPASLRRAGVIQRRPGPALTLFEALVPLACPHCQLRQAAGRPFVYGRILPRPERNAAGRFERRAPGAAVAPSLACPQCARVEIRLTHITPFGIPPRQRFCCRRHGCNARAIARDADYYPALARR